MTIREIIEERRQEIGDAKSLTPDRAAELVTEFSNLLGNINDEIRRTDIAYNRKLLECYNEAKTANLAKIMAETSTEYEEKRIVRDLKEVVIELMRSLKYLIKAYEDEKRGYKYN